MVLERTILWNIPDTPQNESNDAAQQRRFHRRNIARQIAALNVMTHICLSQQTWQLSHTALWIAKDFEKLTTDGERELENSFTESPEVAFERELSEYIDSMRDSEVDASLEDVSTSDYYNRLIDGCHRMYRASIAHSKIATRADNLQIPERFDYYKDKAYQEYVEATVEEELDNRKYLKLALERANLLLSSIKTAMQYQSLDETTLEASESGSQPCKLATLMDTKQYMGFARICLTRVLINGGTEMVKIRATLSFVVPTCCILSCILAFLAWRSSPPQIGTTDDSTFYELLTGIAIQALGLGTVLWPALSSTKLEPYPRMYSVVLAVASAVCMAASVPMYLWVSAGWGPVFSFIGAVAQAFMLLQLTDSLLA
ncbi:hypothetical protein DL765_010436 [Monosporascus sp. GIB2]|nr:hypothetical protein DL765_010436 [Monosporascus sp. GIB2]